MKAYKNINDSSDLRLFRPDLNMKRLKDSMERLSMSGNDFDSQELIDLIGKLVRLGECIRCLLSVYLYTFVFGRMHNDRVQDTTSLYSMIK